MSQSQFVLCRLAACITLILFSSVSSSSQQSAHSDGRNPAVPAVSNLYLSDFGAVGDGVTNDGPALQGALNALADGGGGTLFIPAGHYLIATPVEKDFSGLAASITIAGIASSRMPAPPTASGYELAQGLDLTSEIIPATGENQSAISLTGLQGLMIRHLAFVGRDGVRSDAFVTLYLDDIDDATIHHCEFYGISSFGLIPDLGGGNVIRAIRTQMTIEKSSFLGCTANSGVYAPVVENIEWRGLTVSNSIFLDYGLRDLFSKTGLGAPLSWINMANAAAPTPDSPRREVVVREVFLDEGGWIGITVLPYRWSPPVSAPIDLVYISGLRMNVSNFLTTGHLFYDVRNILIEGSHYGWSHNADSAIKVQNVENVILDELTCVDYADRLRADDRTGRFTVINSVYGDLASLAQTTTVLEAPTREEDPVQYVRQRFIDTLGRPPDPAAHFYWSDLLIKCGLNNECLNQERETLADFLESNPQSKFAISGTVTDENGEPLIAAAVTLSGSQRVVTLTDETGNYRFSHLPTSGNYTLTASKRHYWFVGGTDSFNHPAGDLRVNLAAVRNRHKISGRITKPDGEAAASVTLVLAGSFVTTDTSGVYSFRNLLAGYEYTVVPLVDEFHDFYFTPASTSFAELDADQVANFLAKPLPRLVTDVGSDAAIVLDSVTLVPEPFSIFTAFGFASDNVTRVMLFARNLENVNDSAQVEAEAEDAEGNIYPLEVEYIFDVLGQSSLKQLNIKLSPALPAGEEILLSIKVAGVISNKARIRVRG